MGVIKRTLGRNLIQTLKYIGNVNRTVSNQKKNTRNIYKIYCVRFEKVRIYYYMGKGEISLKNDIR